MVRSSYANSTMDIINYNLMNSSTFPDYKERALGVVHYIHGVNPFGWTYLTNMYSLGATSSINKIYNGWFSTGTKWSDAKTSLCGPIPGLLAGGPNGSTNACTVGGTNNSNVCTSGTKLSLQPMEKAYRDTNIGWNFSTMEQEYGWELTENGIYYQGAYIRLLANFAKPSF